MAQTQASSPPAAPKRGPGRPPRAAQPPLKKVKASETPAQSSPSVQSPGVLSPAPSGTASKLPTKLSEYRPLPTLPSPQSLSLPTSTHQSLVGSGVLQASLDRSRLRWVHHGMFDRYWTKPETGKNARPPPPNNPEAKWMKHRGPCRIRVEPHIFECEVYIEEKPKPALQKMQPQAQYGQGAYGGYGGQYRPGPGQQGQPYGQQRHFAPAHQQTPVRQSPGPLPPQRSQQNTPQQQTDKRTGPDPVISMLATRASSDPELKALMKEVATGAATAEQLRVFQGHIDELTKIISEKKKKEEEEAAAAEAKKAQEQQQDTIQYDGAADQRPPPPHQPSPLYQQQQPWQPPPAVQSPAPPPPPPPAAPPVILQFTTPGATEDRFLFPQNSIIESLSAQHLLCSTLITRHGLAATGSSSAPLDPGTEYFQPVTFMVEVAYGRESLIELVKKFVRPADEVRKWMEATMQRCARAPEAHLALRLPVRGTEGAETEEERAEVEGKLAEEMRRRVGPGAGANVKVVKKPGPKKGEGGRPVGVKNGEGGKKAGVAAGPKEVAATGAGAQAPQDDGKGKEKGEVGEDAGEAKDAVKTDGGEASEPPTDGTVKGEKKEEAKAEEAEAEAAGRPKRAIRKSVRISEG